jgi:hypothetical protein
MTRRGAWQPPTEETKAKIRAGSNKDDSLLLHSIPSIAQIESCILRLCVYMAPSLLGSNYNNTNFPVS